LITERKRKEDFKGKGGKYIIHTYNFLLAPHLNYCWKLTNIKSFKIYLKFGCFYSFFWEMGDEKGRRG